MAQKVYLVKTWDKSGALTNNYEVNLSSDAERAALLKFLRSKFGHVVLESVPTKAPTKRGRK